MPGQFHIAVLCVDPAHLPRSQHSARPHSLAGCGVLRGDAGADKALHHSDSTSPCPFHQLQETTDSQSPWPASQSVSQNATSMAQLGGLCHKMWPHARSRRARRVPLMAGELITPLEQQQWHTWLFKYDCLGLISVFFLFLSKGETKIKSLYPISQALIKWSTWAHALR